MTKNSFITLDNLIGSIASAILKLKTLDKKEANRASLEEFVHLLKFIGEANKPDYKELLYDKNFFVSEEVLSNLHSELNGNLSPIIDFSALIELVSKNLKSYIPEEIAITVSKLKDILVILLNTKPKNQVYL